MNVVRATNEGFLREPGSESGNAVAEQRAHRTLRSRAPIRLDLAGGWTDVPPFSAEMGGAVLNAAINRYAYASVSPHESPHIHIISADFDRELTIASADQIAYNGDLDLIKAAIKRLGVRCGMTLFVRCQAPPGSGTGSSAAIGVALVGLLSNLQGQDLPRDEMAELAHRLETEELSIAGGRQDQYAAAYGGINFIEFHDPAAHVSRLELPPEVVNELEKHLVLCYTGKSRVSGDIISRVMGAYRARVSATVNALHRLAGIAREMRAALLGGDLRDFGAMLLENWEQQKQLDPSVSNPDTDALFEAALANGASGGKALGAGGGGCLLFYTRPDQEHRLRGMLEARGVPVLDFNFDFHGLQTWESGSG